MNDPYDRRILFEVAKRRVEENDYAEDTSFEEEDNAGQGEEEQEERRESLAFLRRLLNSARVDGQINDEEGDEHGYLMSIPAPDRSQIYSPNIQASTPNQYNAPDTSALLNNNSNGQTEPE